MSTQQTNVGAGQAVFREQRDSFEKSRTQIVVKVFRIQFLLAQLHQAGAHVGFEFCDQDRVAWRSRQIVSSNSRRNAMSRRYSDSAVETNCETRDEPMMPPFAATRPSRRNACH